MAIRERLGHLRRLAEDVAQRALKPAGYQLTRRHFYSPIPIVEELPPSLWDGPSELPGVDLRIEHALALLNGPLLPYLAEFHPPLYPSGPGGLPSSTGPGGLSPTALGGSSSTSEPGRFWLRNNSYESVDAETLYAILRQLKPARVHELGSGASTHVIHLAALANARDGKPLEHTVFDPFPYQASPMGPVPSITAHPLRAEDLDPARFAALRAGDVLFVDTTHTVRTGGDVTHIFLEIFPRLAPGVTIHVHDIFLPYEYPRDWVVDQRRAWAEQYLLQAFLACNRDFEVVMPTYALARAAPDALKRVVPSFDPHTVRPGAFWIRRRA
ncbi:MAG: class I SAM-dependent methyltransferase [Solirubrobacteraceae bacterium]